MTQLASTTDPVTIRSRVEVPLRFSDGYTTSAEVLTFNGLSDEREHLALALGDWKEAVRSGTPLVRPHSECLTGDVFGSERCDCGPQLREAAELITEQGGLLLYLRQEGRGIGLYAKLDAYALQDQGLDTYEANRALGHGDDERDYTAAVEILRVLGVGEVDLLSNNPDKRAQLESAGLVVRNVVRTGVHVSEHNRSYLGAKVSTTGHLLDLPLAG